MFLDCHMSVGDFSPCDIRRSFARMRMRELRQLVSQNSTVEEIQAIGISTSLTNVVQS
jgi:hypothetical protein